MALRNRSSKDVKKSSYYVWYLGAREAKGVDAMPGAIDYLLERERQQEPFKVTLQVRANRALRRFTSLTLLCMNEYTCRRVADCFLCSFFFYFFFLLFALLLFGDHIFGY